MRYFTTILLSLVFVSLTACDTQKSERQKHEPTPNDTEMFIHGLSELNATQKLTELIDYYYKHKDSFLKSLKNEDYDAYSLVVEPLTQVFFDERFTTNKDHRDINKVSSVLHLFHHP